MIDDEARFQLEALQTGNRPLIVSDIDEVILNFVQPFKEYLDHQGFVLRTETYKLTGNVFEKGSDKPTEGPEVFKMLSHFFVTQSEWQDLVDGALPALNRLHEHFDIVLLTAMPHAHREERISFMREIGVPFPILTVESDKGHSVAHLAKGRPGVAFIDDLAHNHESVAAHAPETHLFQYMAFREFDGPLPIPPLHTQYHEDWEIMEQAIRKVLL
ncbi:MAG: hypothetical protein ACRCT6_02660 [Notoacmeibacter sp.]